MSVGETSPRARLQLALAALALPLLAASGCGFQLRGTADLPPLMQRTYLQMPDRYGEFGRALERTLAANNVEVVENRERATAVLEIPTARFSRRAAAFAGTARVREFRLTLRVAFRLRDGGGDSVTDRREVVLFRDYSFDEREILAGTREEEFLRRDLQARMVDELLRRLERLEPVT